VTGRHGAEEHMGNVFVTDHEHPETLDRTKGANLASLNGKFTTEGYLTPYSDIVSLMVLEHQTRMTNLLIRVNWETRMAILDREVINKAMGQPLDQPTDSSNSRIRNATDTLLEYMLFTDEAPLAGPIRGSTTFAADYERQGRRSRRGLSLRDLDLKIRLLRHPCSPMIYSEAFDALPAPSKDRIYQRLWEILSGKDDSRTYARISPADRREILEILLDTKPDLPAYWKRP
jgi:hypothetical protein